MRCSVDEKPSLHLVACLVDTGSGPLAEDVLQRPKVVGRAGRHARHAGGRDGDSNAGTRCPTLCWEMKEEGNSQISYRSVNWGINV